MNSNLKDIQFPEMNISLSLTFENPPISTEKRILRHSCLLQTKKIIKYGKNLQNMCYILIKNLLNRYQVHRRWHTHRKAMLSRRHSWALSIAINKIQLEMEQISGNF